MEDADCLIIGGGPAGLTAAVYLARYQRRVLLVDDGQSRAALIPKTRNYPGFADGIEGPSLLSRLRRQADAYAVSFLAGRVETLVKDSDHFAARIGGSTRRASRVILATGLKDTAPPMAGLQTAVARGLVRYCPICDGFEARGKRVAVLGDATGACGKALFLRTYSKSVTLLSGNGQTPSDVSRRELSEAEVSFIADPIARLELASDTVEIVFCDGSRRRFEVVYPMHGGEVRSELAVALGAAHRESGCLHVDGHQRTSIEGLYAVGDVVSDLHQIAVGIGHAAVAATDIHNRLPRNLC